MTEHFTEQELNVASAEARIKENALYLCANILEPIRAKFGPLLVTSGYRDPVRNAAAGGKKASFHLYEDDQCAADFKVPGVDILEVFRWLRLESHLPFDKAILEYANGEPRIIHVQAYAKNAPRRLAYTGETGDGQKYLAVTVNA
jgi:hypothetical protein